MKKRPTSRNIGWARARRRVLASLNEQNLQLLRLICRVDEPTYVVIADEMRMKVHAVHALREKLFRQFDIHSKVGLVLFAYRWGILG